MTAPTLVGSELLDGLRRVADRHGWQFQVVPTPAADPVTAGPDEVLLHLRRTARRQQEHAVQLSREADVKPNDATARRLAGQAWKKSEARWQALDTYEAAMASAARTASSPA